MYYFDHVSQYTCSITVIPFDLPCKVVYALATVEFSVTVSLYIGNMPLTLMAKFSWVVIFLKAAIY